MEGGFPAESSGQTLTDLVAEGLFDADLAAHLDRVGAMPRDRTLYTHQRDAVVETSRESADGGRPALVVTAGTGAGKTECFLLPLLHDLFRHNADGDGMRCLILYPMNALVNDQVGRLYDWLKGQSRVTLFNFTSETPEDARAADFDKSEMWEACRMRTRQEAPDWRLTRGRKMRMDLSAPNPTS